MAMSRLEWIKKIIMMVVIRVILGGKFMSEWNAALYDNKHDFVAEYGKGLLEFVPENNNQSILDFWLRNWNSYSTIKEVGRSGDWC